MPRLRFRSEKERKIIENAFLCFKMVKNEDLLKEYLDFCYTNEVTSMVRKKATRIGCESHHVVPRRLLKLYVKNIEDYKKVQMVYNDNYNRILLTHEDHIKAHILLNEALRKFPKRILNYTVGYPKTYKNKEKII